MNIINAQRVLELAKKACAPNQTFNSDPEWLERFAALVRAEPCEQCEELGRDKATYYRLSKLFCESFDALNRNRMLAVDAARNDDMERVIYLLSKAPDYKPAEREWVDLTDDFTIDQTAPKRKGTSL